MDQAIQPIQPKHFLTIGQLIKNTWQTYKVRFKTLIAINLVGTILVLAIIFGFIGGAVLSTGNVKAQSNPFFWILIVIGFVGSVYVALWSEAAILKASLDFNETFGSAYKNSKNKVGAIFLTSFISGLIVMVGFILLIVPGLIFLTWYSLAVLIVMAEGQTSLDAIKRSKEYVKGYTGPVMIRYALIFVLLWLANLVVNIIFGKQLGQVINTVVNLIFSPFAILYTIEIYKNLKDIKNQPPLAEFDPFPKQTLQ
ncbi:MAG: hypothetical protein HY336_02815 [Candidatus Doudnabacteria bacterium]|nr:hypothetical protein [Candidatus Doudnabacteria bacterium]